MAGRPAPDCATTFASCSRPWRPPRIVIRPPLSHEGPARPRRPRGAHAVLHRCAGRGPWTSQPSRRRQRRAREGQRRSRRTARRHSNARLAWRPAGSYRRRRRDSASTCMSGGAGGRRRAGLDGPASVDGHRCYNVGYTPHFRTEPDHRRATARQRLEFRSEMSSRRPDWKPCPRWAPFTELTSGT